jgi:hypothetical protein
MKSVEVKLNEALAELKSKVSPTKFTEVSEKLSGFAPIADKLKLVEEALAEQMPDESDRSFTGMMNRMTHEFREAKTDCGVLFDLEPRTAPTVKETVAPINKHNGACENFVEGSPFNEGRTAGTAANSTRKDSFAGGDAVLLEHMTYPPQHPNHGQRISEADKSKLRGEKPAAYANLTEKKKKDYDFARQIGLSEADALRVATI